MGKSRKQLAGKDDQHQGSLHSKSGTQRKQGAKKIGKINENALDELAQYPTTLDIRQQAILRLQRSEGNRQVTKLLRKIAKNKPLKYATWIKEPYRLPTERTDIKGHVLRKSTTEKEEDKEVNPPPGPYGPRRLRNDKMDPFEYKKNIFAPKIFISNLPSRDHALWKPLADLIHQYWVVNSGNASGIKISSARQKNAAWKLVKATASAKDMRVIKDNVSRQGETVALTEAVFVVFSQHYPRTLRKARQGYRKSDYRLDHEYYAVNYGFVKKPYAYFSRAKSKR